MTARVPDGYWTCAEYLDSLPDPVELQRGQLIALGHEARSVCRQTGTPWHWYRKKSWYPEQVLATALESLLESQRALVAEALAVSRSLL